MLLVEYRTDGVYRYRDISLHDTLEEAEIEAMISKLSGKIFGYEVFDFTNKYQYYDANWIVLKNNKISHWYDKEAIMSVKYRSGK